MLIKRPAAIIESEITDKDVYLNRRRFLQAAVAAGAIGTSGLLMSCDVGADGRGAKLDYTAGSPFSTDEEQTKHEFVTTYNNYWEFGKDKDDPHMNSGEFKPKPWSIEIAGKAEITGTFDFEDIVSPMVIEERIYRLRCVEAWSMVIPWLGFELGTLLKRFKPLSSAKYVAFETVFRPSEMPAQDTRLLDWPYVEGLRIDEAMHPLTLLAVGLYGEELLNQNGAPLRLVVPWKYGFKSIKSIVKITFTEEQPPNTWNTAQPREYGFYSNVNPEVDHPRWSQARERPIGAGLFGSKKPTLMLNGYADQVADRYTGMDLAKFY